MTFQKGHKLSKGRPKGSKNRRQSVLAKAKQLGFDPLVYALEIAANEKLPRPERMEAAKIALPYCHPKLSSSHTTKATGEKTHAEWVQEIKLDLEQQDQKAEQVAEEGENGGHGDDRGAKAGDLISGSPLSVIPGGKAS